MTEKSKSNKAVVKFRKTIEERDLLGFSREHFKIVGFCRRALFQGDRDSIKRWYSDLTLLITWFDRGGRPEWPEVDRSMGGMELLIGLMGDFLETTTLDDTLAEVVRSAVDQRILVELHKLHKGGGGIKSGDLASLIGRKANSVSNRLPVLEGMGLIARTKVGKNSVIYLTPKGKGIIERLNSVNNKVYSILDSAIGEDNSASHTQHRSSTKDDGPKHQSKVIDAEFPSRSGIGSKKVICSEDDI